MDLGFRVWGVLLHRGGRQHAEMAPQDTQGCGGRGGGISGDGTSLVPNKPGVGVGLFFPPPACAGIRPTLIPVWFRADALNSHFSLNS